MGKGYIYNVRKSVFCLLTRGGEYGKINANCIAVSVTDGECGLPRGNRDPWSPYAPFADRLGTLISWYDMRKCAFFDFYMEEHQNDQEKSRNSDG